MIKFYASDIIKSADQIADLENSSYISYKEKIRLLNECYMQVYQKLINMGDNTYVKKVKIKNTGNGKYLLPTDFYQLKSVTLADSGVAILRKAETESENTLRYELENNCIVIYGASGVSDITMKYYPTPPTLTFPNKIENEIGLDFTPLTQYNSGGVFAYTDIQGQEVKLTIKSPHEEFTETILIDFPEVDKVLCYTTELTVVCVITNKDKIGYVYVYDLPTHTSRTYIVNAGEDIAGFNKTKICFLDTGDGHIVLYHSNSIYAMVNGDLVECITGEGFAYLKAICKNYLGDFANCDDYKCGCIINNLAFLLCENKVRYKEYGNFIDIAETEKYRIFKYENSIAFFDNDLIVVNQEGETIYTDSDIDEFYALDYNGTYYVMSSYEVVVKRQIAIDTFLNYPNSLFFPYLAYMLAVEYKIKQGADVSGLSAISQEKQNQFYDSIPQDEFGQTRINNVYGRTM